MSVASVLHDPLPEAEHSVQLRKAVIASTVGTTIEWYDFLLYSIVTPLVFGKLFFPHSDPLIGVLEAFAIYIVGFVGRPIGAVIFGHYGDRMGRKAALIATLLITGLATFAVGFVPGYNSIGIWGAVLLTVIRMIQGIGVGGEWGGSVLFVDGMGAHQQASRLYHLMAAIRRPAGLFLANMAVLVVRAISGDQFFVWGWRIPFLLSIIMVGDRALHPARHPGDPGLPQDRRRGARRAGAGGRGDEASAQTGFPGDVRAHRRAGPGLHLSGLRVRLRQAGPAHVARLCADLR